MAIRNVALGIAGAAALGLAVPGIADAQTFAETTTDLNLRAGPGMDQPVIGVMPAGAQLEIHQCLEARVWCEVTFAGMTGWASERFLTAEFEFAPDRAPEPAEPRPGVAPEPEPAPPAAPSPGY